jgi:lipoprotein-anchoring transpeptidase ErfK/SrfK
MISDTEAAQKALFIARRSLQQGDRQGAYIWAEKAASICPKLEEPWLILAAVSNPHASVSYLERALKINPGSERARKGMHWAAKRLREETKITPQPSPATNTQVFKTITKYRWSILPLLVVVVCFSIAFAFLPGSVAPALAFFHLPQAESTTFGAWINVDKPTYTPTFNSTFTPTNTFTPTPTLTDTPTPTATQIPTETFTPSSTTIPIDTPQPWPTETPASNSTGDAFRWIDVNLSQQMLYAYEGNIIVASFLVSTGVPAFPTVTGQFHIYIKLVSTLMYGDGYYLPNVPYTMYFYKGYGLHGTYWHNNFGHPMSHGCVNMFTSDSEWLFYWASVGTLVNIHY